MDHLDYIKPAESYLLVCLCDVDSKDVSAPLIGCGTGGHGILVTLCDQHKSVKLESLASAGVRTAVKFAHYDEKGDFYAKTLSEILDERQLKNQER